MNDRERSAHWNWLWVVGYALLAAVVVWSLFAARRWALTELATPQSIQHWQTWRDEVRGEQGGAAPVQRRVPTSSEPPMLVLLRDHFAVMLAAAIVFSMVLFWITAWFVTGILSTSAREQWPGKQEPSQRQ